MNPFCTFCEFPLDEEEENHRCLAYQDGCGCGEDCPIKVDKCECVQCLRGENNGTI